MLQTPQDVNAWNAALAKFSTGIENILKKRSFTLIYLCTFADSDSSVKDGDDSQAKAKTPIGELKSYFAQINKNRNAIRLVTQLSFWNCSCFWLVV